MAITVAPPKTPHTIGTHGAVIPFDTIVLFLCCELIRLTPMPLVNKGTTLNNRELSQNRTRMGSSSTTVQQHIKVRKALCVDISEHYPR